MYTLPSITHCSGMGICCIVSLQNSRIISILSLRWMKSLSMSPCSSFSLLWPHSASLTPLFRAGTELLPVTFLSVIAVSWFSECNFTTMLEKTLSGLCSSPSSVVSELMERERTAWRARLLDLRETMTWNHNNHRSQQFKFRLRHVFDRLQQNWIWSVDDQLKAKCQVHYFKIKPKSFPKQNLTLVVWLPKANQTAALYVIKNLSVTHSTSANFLIYLKLCRLTSHIIIYMVLQIPFHKNNIRANAPMVTELREAWTTTFSRTMTIWLKWQVLWHLQYDKLKTSHTFSFQNSFLCSVYYLL